MEAQKSSPSTINPPVFYGSAILVVALVIYSVAFSDHAQALFSSIQSWIIANVSWLYILAVAIILLTVVLLALSRFGDIKLGPDHSEPDYSSTTWFAMLFSAGMGIGLMFFGVAEPVMHFLEPPSGEGSTAIAAREAMGITFFHWGVHAWAIYAAVALILAYFSFRHGLPLTLRSALYPMLGDRIYGPVGHAVDIFAIIGTKKATPCRKAMPKRSASFSTPKSFTMGVAKLKTITAMLRLSPRPTRIMPSRPRRTRSNSPAPTF